MSRCNRTSSAGSVRAGGDRERFTRQPPRPILQDLLDREAGQVVTEGVPVDPCQQHQAKAALLADGALEQVARGGGEGEDQLIAEATQQDHGARGDARGFRGVISYPGDTPMIIECSREHGLGIVRDEQAHLMNGMGKRSSWKPGQRRDVAGRSGLEYRPGSHPWAEPRSRGGGAVLVAFCSRRYRWFTDP